MFDITSGTHCGGQQAAAHSDSEAASRDVCLATTGGWRAVTLEEEPVVRRPCESWRRRVEEVRALGRTAWPPLAAEAREEWEEDSLSSTSVLRE